MTKRSTKQQPSNGAAAPRVNIQAGDVPETDQEVEKAIDKMNRQAASKALAKQEQQTTTLLDGQIVADPAEAAANSDEYQGEEVVLDGNLEVATGATADALMQAEKPRASGSVLPAQTVKGAAKAAKAAKTPKAAKVVSTMTAGGHSRLTAQLVMTVLAELAAGKKRPIIAIEYDLGTGTVSDIAAGSPYIRKMLEKAGQAHPKGAYVPYIRPVRP